jgi:ABC-type Fe3+ transport system substrate-binding protein
MTIDLCRTAPFLLLLGAALWHGTPARGAATEPATIVIVSPHPASVREEIGAAFAEDLEIETAAGRPAAPAPRIVWIDQGGSYADLGYVRQKFAEKRRRKGKSAGLDLFWGGGSESFDTLTALGVLAPIVGKGRPFTTAGLTQGLGAVLPGTFDPKGYWIGTALSTFGLIAGGAGSPFATWDALAEPALVGHVVASDPRFSSVAGYVLPTMVESLGAQDAWRLWFAFYGASAGNVARRSGDVIQAVAQDPSGGRAGIAIDYLAAQAAAARPEARLRFVRPTPSAPADVDPIGMFKDAPHAKLAERFLRFVLSERGQRVLSQRPGVGGPKKTLIGREATLKILNDGSTGLPPRQPPALPRAFWRDVIGATFVDGVADVRAVWQACAKLGAAGKAKIEQATTLPWDEKALAQVAKGWETGKTRSRTLDDVHVAFAAALRRAAESCRP